MRRKNDRLQSKKVHTTETPPAQPKTAAAALARINPFTYGLLGALGVLVALLTVSYTHLTLPTTPYV